jgi:hypothetical protein
MTNPAANDDDAKELTRGERSKAVDRRLTGAGLRRSLDFTLSDWESLLTRAGIEDSEDPEGGDRATTEATILDRAAGVLTRRYGVLVAGGLISALRNRADALREGTA